MRRVMLAALLVLAAGKLAAVGAGEKADREKLQGTWVATAGEKAGHQAAESGLKDVTLTFKDDEFTCTMANRDEMRGTFSVDTTKDPRQLKMKTNDLTLAGIYRLEKDELKLCFNHGDEPPTEFATKEGGRTCLLVLKRKMP